VAIVEPVYCTREEVLDAMDFRESTLRIPSVDSAIAGGARDVDDLCHRQFYPDDTIRSFDWPNFQRAYPWRIWLERAELADVTTNVPVVTSGGNVITADQVLWGPWDDEAPPYTFMELNRGGNASFGQGDTPQQDVKVQGTFGYWTRTEARGTLYGTINASAQSLVCSDGGLVTGLGVGDILVVDSERMIVSGKSVVTSNQTVVSGATTSSKADDQLTVASGAFFNVGEQLLVGSEKMYITDIAGNVLIVRRAWGGSTLAAHTSGDGIYVYRTLQVQRASLGTVAASHTQNVVLNRVAIPGPIRELNVAEAINNVLQKTSGYARTIGAAGGNIANASGAGLADIRDRVFTGYARKARTAVI
jgi:hypothetical protein